MPENEDAVPAEAGNVAKRSVLAERLVQRLQAGTMTANDRETVQRVREILALRHQKVAASAIAKQLGIAVRTYYHYVQTPIFQAVSTYLLDHGEMEGSKNAKQLREHELRMLGTYVPKALRFIGAALAETKEGVFVNPKLAQWATQLLADHRGWTQAEPDRNPQITVKSVVINQVTQQIRDSDAKMAAAHVIDVTPSTSAP